MPRPKEVDGWEVSKKRKKTRFGGKQQERPKEKFWGSGFTLAEEKQIVYSTVLLALFQSNKIGVISLVHLNPF